MGPNIIDWKRFVFFASSSVPQKQVLAAADEGSIFCLACPLSALNLVWFPNNPQTIEKAWSETSKWQQKIWAIHLNIKGCKKYEPI